MFQSLSPSQDRFKSEEHRFKELADSYAAALGTLSVKCVPYDDSALPLFSKATQEKKLRAIEFLESALSVFEEVRTAGGSLRDNRTLIWRTLNRLKFIPDSEIFDKMGDDDVIEIYSLPENSHLAWNIRLMEQVSFTAEQLLCLPWWEICSRPAEITAELQRTTGCMFSGEYTKTFTPSVPKHLILEQNSHELLIIELEIKYVSPLRQAGRNVAFLAVNRGRVVGSQKR